MYLAWDSQPARLTLSTSVNDPYTKATSEDGQREEFVYTESANKIEGEDGW